MCLIDYIGLRGLCNDTVPPSGKYINDLPSISLKMLSSISNEEQQTYVDLWNEVQRATINDIESDILIKMQKYFKTNLLIDNEYFGYYKNNFPVNDASNFLKGAHVKIYGSKFLDIYVNKILLRLEDVVDTEGEIYIYNANDGRLLDTIEFDAVEGVNEIEINKRYKAEGQRLELFICYDGNIADNIETTYGDYFDYNSFMLLRGGQIAVGSSVLSSGITYSGNTHGLMVNLNVQCSISSFICSIRDLISNAYWYKLGANITNIRLNTDRMNKFTLLNKEQAVELRDMYEEKYSSNLESVLNNVEPTGDSICLVCNKKRMYTYSLP